MAVVCIPSKVSAQVTTPVTAGSGQTVLIPTNQSIHVPTGNAISATAGGIISGTGITAITAGNIAAVNSSGAGSLISLGGNTILTGARGGAWMDNGGLVKLGSGTIINVTGSSAGAGGFTSITWVLLAIHSAQALPSTSMAPMLALILRPGSVQPFMAPMAVHHSIT